MKDTLSKEKRNSKLSPSVSEYQFIMIFVGIMERVLNKPVSSDISHLIIRYVNVTKRLDYSNDRHCGNFEILDNATINKRTHGYRTVLCGDGEPLDRSRGTKYEIVFRINKMGYRFFIGYVFGSIQEIDFEECLGGHSNKKNSVGIRIVGNKFHLYEEDHYRKQLECESEDGPSRFTEQGQIWRVSWDLIDNEMEISVLNQQETDWIPMIHYAMKQEHRDVIPALGLYDKDDSITLLSE